MGRARHLRFLLQREMDADWLKENVGEALALAMADMARNKPEDPVEFLGRHLINSACVLEKKEARRRFAKSVKNRKDFEDPSEDDSAEEALLKFVREEPCFGDLSATEILNEFDEKLQALIAMIKKSTRAENVFIITLKEDGAALVNYSTNLSLQGESIAKGAESVIFELLEDDQGEESITTKHVQVDNMLSNEKAPFLGRIPLLASFLAVRVPFERHLHESSIPGDGGMLATEDEHEDNAEGENEDLESKTHANEQDSKVEEEGDQETETKEEEGTVPNSKSRWRSRPLNTFMVICLDTLGSDTYDGGFSNDEVQLLLAIADDLSLAATKFEEEAFDAEMRRRDAFKERTSWQESIADLRELCIPPLKEVLNALTVFSQAFNEVFRNRSIISWKELKASLDTDQWASSLNEAAAVLQNHEQLKTEVLALQTVTEPRWISILARKLLQEQEE